jgi:hypothetical protein
VLAASSAPAAELLGALSSDELRAVADGATLARPGPGDAFGVALDATILFARRRHHGAARAAFGVALAELRASGARGRDADRRFRLFACGAYVYYAAGRLARAEMLTRCALAHARRLSAAERGPAERRARKNRATVLRRMGRGAEALALLAGDFAAAPSATAALNLAFAQHEAKQDAGLLRVLDHPAIAWEPREAACAELLRAAALHRTGEEDAALAALARYRVLAEEHGFARELAELVPR